MTVEEFLIKRQKELGYNPCIDFERIKETLSIFAKLKCKEVLEFAVRNARIIDDPSSYTGNTGSEYPPDQIVDKSSILNCINMIEEFEND